MNVRTIGTNRPSTIARLPYFSKNSCVLGHVLGLEQLRLRLVEDRRAGDPPDPVAARRCPPTRRRPAPGTPATAAHRSPPLDTEQAGGEQQRVTRQEEADEQPAFGEDDRGQADQGPRAEPGDDRVGLQPLGAEREDGQVVTIPAGGYRSRLTRARAALPGRAATTGRVRRPTQPHRAGPAAAGPGADQGAQSSPSAAGPARDGPDGGRRRGRSRRGLPRHEAGAPGPGRLGAHRLGQPALRLLAGGHGHQRPARGFITRATASSARLAVDLTVPRVMPVASAISASDSPP